MNINLNNELVAPPASIDKQEIKEKNKALIEELKSLQNVLYAQGKNSLLIVLQGMDASGKDGAIKKVFRGVNPMGCRVTSFKKPTEEEMAHDFLWRIHKNVPAKGMIQIFNRSHYEDVVIQKIHKWVDEDTIKRRYDHINAFEKLLQENNTVILKFFLHISQQQQHERLQERMTDPEKMWKHNDNDMNESSLWNNYMKAYEEAFNKCSPEIPWTIVPSEKNWYKQFIISNKIVSELKQLSMQYPSLPIKE